MSETSDLRHEDNNEAVQAVVDRVLSYQAGAPVDTVRVELEQGLDEIGAPMAPDWVLDIAERISAADPADEGGPDQ